MSVDLEAAREALAEVVSIVHKGAWMIEDYTVRDSIARANAREVFDPLIHELDENNPLSQLCEALGVDRDEIEGGTDG